ncbi:Gldg family protein [Hirschia litorea]|uniref:Gldg family protein n=1 Tax=Hirschia litorea TaxID=1199156 RepID=A0ABW2IML9_9PROT
MKTKHFTLAISALAVLIFGGLNITSQNWLSSARVDMTENKLYTLSSAAKGVAANLAEPIELQFVYSRKLAADFPAIRTYGARVRELLSEIAARSGGDVIIVETDPEPFSDEEERLIDAGIQSTQTDSGDPLYMAIVGRNSVDDEIVIPYLAPEREALLEYDLVKLISQLDDPLPARIGVLTSLVDFAGSGQSPKDYYLLREMARSYEIVPIDPNFVVLPEKLDALMIVHPPKLSPRQQYLIEQGLLRIGRAIIALDPTSKASVAARGRRAHLTSSLGPIEAMLGLTPLTEVVIDKEIGLPVERIENGRRFVEVQPLFIAPPRGNMSNDDPVTADLARSINFGAAGVLNVTPALGADFEPLVWTTAQAMMISSQRAGREVTPRELMSNYAGLGVQQTLIGRLTGELQSTFTDAIPPIVIPDDPVLAALAKDSNTELPHLEKSEQAVDIILISDADMFDDTFYVSPNGGAPVADNAAFVLNALDNLSGSDALVHLRSRAPSARPMTRVDDMRAAARERLYEEQEILQTRLQQTEARLDELRASGAGGGLLGNGLGMDAIDQAEAEELTRFRAEAIEIRQRLREVEREFRADIDKLSGRLALFNVWVPPALIILIGFFVVGWRNRSKGRSR